MYGDFNWIKIWIKNENETYPTFNARPFLIAKMIIMLFERLTAPLFFALKFQCELDTFFFI